MNNQQKIKSFKGLQIKEVEVKKDCTILRLNDGTVIKAEIQLIN